MDESGERRDQGEAFTEEGQPGGRGEVRRDQRGVVGADGVVTGDVNTSEAICRGEIRADQEQGISAAADVKNASLVPVGSNQLVGLTGPLPS